VDRFQKGVRECLAENAYGSVSFFAFVGCVADAADGSDPTWMAPFVYQSDFPLLDVEASPTGGDESVRVKALNYSDVAQPWPSKVPVAYRRTDGEVASAWITGEAELEALGSVLNWKARGYYRVRYSPELLKRVLGEPGAELGRLSALADAVALHKDGLFWDRAAIVDGMDQVASGMGATVGNLSHDNESQWFRQQMLSMLKEQV